MALQVWYPLNKDLQNQGVHPITEGKIPSTCAIASTGQLGQCYVNTGGTVQNTDINITTLAWSLCCWCRVDTRTNGWASSIGLNGDNGAYIGIICQSTNGTTSGFHYYSKVSGTNTKIFDDYCLTGPTLGEWHHYAICYDGSKYYIYLDGALLKQGSAARSETNHFTTIKLFGSQSGVLKGALNDVRFYDECLSAKQIEEISKGLILHYTMSDVPNKNNVNYTVTTEQVYTYPSSSFSDKITAKTVDIPSGTTYTISFWAKASVAGSRITTHFYSPNTTTTYKTSSGQSGTAGDGHAQVTLAEANKWYHCWVTYEQNNTTANKSVIWCRLWSDRGSGTITLKQPKLEEGNAATAWSPAGEASTTIYDISGYKYNGILYGDWLTENPSPRYLHSLHCRSGSDYIRVPLGFTLSEFSIGIWFNQLQTGTHTPLFSNQKQLGANNLWVACNTENSAIWSYDGNYCMKAGSVPVNTWHHCVYTYQNGFGSLYLDGELYTTKQMRTTSINFDDLWIGNGYTGSSWNTKLYAYLSDFRMYGTVLTATQVKEWYETSMEIDSNGNILPRILTS